MGAITAGGVSTIGNPYMFTGRRYDSETASYYYRSRYLDPHAGRFTVRDIIGVWKDLLNLGSGYTYSGNNPPNMVDPYGYACCTADQYATCIARAIGWGTLAGFGTFGILELDSLGIATWIAIIGGVVSGIGTASEVYQTCCNSYPPCPETPWTPGPTRCGQSFNKTGLASLTVPGCATNCNSILESSQFRGGQRTLRERLTREAHHDALRQAGLECPQSCPWPHAIEQQRDASCSCVDALTSGMVVVRCAVTNTFSCER
jgi:RHS repeat-associated protein